MSADEKLGDTSWMTVRRGVHHYQVYDTGFGWITVAQIKRRGPDGRWIVSQWVKWESPYSLTFWRSGDPSFGSYEEVQRYVEVVCRMENAARG